VLRVLLVGMMGAGKTTTGRLVAERLGCPYLDSDEEVQRMTGHSVPELLRSEGEAAFRTAETAALDDALERNRQVVVSVAGGAVLDPYNRQLIKRSGIVVWLRASVATLCARVGDGAGRPLLDEGPPAALARLAAVRRPYYEDVADAVVDVDGLSPEDVAEKVLGLVAAASKPAR
jgi:shikimate kinase